jgi:hypothetical protein
MMWTAVLFLGFGMAIDPVRLGLAVVLMSRRRPLLNLFAFWLGGMAAAIALATAVLVIMRDVALLAIHSAAGAIEDFRSATAIFAGGRLQITLGVIMLLSVAVLSARERAAAAAPARIGAPGTGGVALEDRPPTLFARLGARTQRKLESGFVWSAFGVGAASSTPPVESLVALTVIMASKAALGMQLGAFIVFVLMVLAVIEIPLIGYLVMPDKTEALMLQVQNWMSAYRRQIVQIVLVLVGVIFLVQGVARL